MQITVDIPHQVADELFPQGTDPARLLLEHAVAQAYRERRLTMEQVRQALGFGTRLEVDPFLLKYEVYDYTIEDLEKDMATHDHIFGRISEKAAA